MNNKYFDLSIFRIIIRRLRSLRDKDPEKIDPNPRIGWLLIIGTFVFLSFGFIWFYYQMFSFPDVILMATSTSDEAFLPLENISKGKLEKTLAPWNEREKKFNEYFGKRPDFDFLK